MSSLRQRVLLLLPTTSYKAEDFMDAAARLGVDVVVGTDRSQALERLAPGGTLLLDFARPERAVHAILALSAERPLAAVVGADDETVVLATMAAAALGLPHNPVESARATRDKYEMRSRLAAAHLRVPAFRRVALDASIEAVASEVSYPCVLKPLALSASRGVLRVDDPQGFASAFRRIAAILRDPDVRGRGGDASALLVEEYIHGAEVAVEGVLEEGRLRVLALFDKPDPLHGPTFEETLYVTPSRLPEATRTAIVRETALAAEALGLLEGPVHAELRVAGGEPWILEIAARTIGGLCSRALRFGAGVSLEELILRHALGLATESQDLEGGASGVMMIPVPKAGVLRGVQGVEAARAVPRVEEVTISLHNGAAVVPLPEGHRYLGFVFARGSDPAEVERALRQAHACLRFDISPSS